MALLETDPVVFKRLPDGDLKFPLEYASGLEAVAIGCRTRLQMCRGEWFLNLFVGLPLLPTTDPRIVPERAAILGQAFDPIKVRAAVLQELLATPGVLEVPFLRQRFDGPSRVLSVSWIARTAFGDTPEDQLALNVSGEG